jgi:hypothetical protein
VAEDAADGEGAPPSDSLRRAAARGRPDAKKMEISRRRLESDLLDTFCIRKGLFL